MPVTSDSALDIMEQLLFFAGGDSELVDEAIEKAGPRVEDMLLFVLANGNEERVTEAKRRVAREDDDVGRYYSQVVEHILKSDSARKERLFKALKRSQEEQNKERAREPA